MFGSVNAHRSYFEQGVADFAMAESLYPGWLASQFTHPIQGLDNYAELLRILFEEKEAIKGFLIIDAEADLQIASEMHPSLESSFDNLNHSVKKGTLS